MSSRPPSRDDILALQDLEIPDQVRDDTRECTIIIKNWYQYALDRKQTRMPQNPILCQSISHLRPLPSPHQHHRPAIGKILADDAVEVDTARQIFSPNREAARRASLEKALVKRIDPATVEIEEVDVDVLRPANGQGEGGLWRGMGIGSAQDVRGRQSGGLFDKG
ncbi:MAG: hypothetical protein O7B35_00480, partial [Deltaproteobacteria bacterium]|nr:hypothetical protein [Deltaproteobacteria bacterium]